MMRLVGEGLGVAVRAGRTVLGWQLAVVRGLPGGATVVRAVEDALGIAETAPRPGPRAPDTAERPRTPPPPAPVSEPDPPVEAHVEQEVELVAEVADAEAAGGAGPELHVDEPFDGYRQLTAAQVVELVAGATPEVLAAVELYEATHKGRKQVLSAVEAELKRVSAPRG